MKKTLTLPCYSLGLAALVAAGALTAPSTARAGHVYAGITNTNGTPGLQAGDALAFVDSTTGNAITGASLGTLSMSMVTAITPQTGLYRATSPTFTALSRGLAYEGSAYLATGNAFAASAGSFLQIEIVSVTGPAGAVFKFWEGTVPVEQFAYTIGSGLTSGSGIITLTDREAIVGNGTDPTIEGDYDAVTTGRQNPTYPNAFNDPLDTPSNWRWNDADGVGGVAPADPFGHIHNRSFTTDQPGTYTVSYVIKDTSGLQADSQPFTVSYSAVPEPGTLGALAGGFGVFLLLLRRRGQPGA